MPAGAAPATQLSHQIRRALHRVEEGKVVSIQEAAALLACRGDDLERLFATARRVRDAGVGRTVTYSPKVFIPVTRLCRDRCGYCTFALGPSTILVTAIAARNSFCVGSPWPAIAVAGLARKFWTITSWMCP